MELASEDWKTLLDAASTPFDRTAAAMASAHAMTSLQQGTDRDVLRRAHAQIAWSSQHHRQGPKQHRRPREAADTGSRCCIWLLSAISS